MKHISLLSIIICSFFATTLYAEETHDFENQAWYKSKEINTAINFSKKYNEKCLSMDNPDKNCKFLEKEISDNFNNSILDNEAVEYITLQVHPDYEKYSQVEYASFLDFKKNLAELAINGKNAYIQKLLNSKYFLKNEKSEDVIAFKKDLRQLASFHKTYTNSVCSLGNTYFNPGSGAENSVLSCLSEYNLNYLSSLNDAIVNLEGTIMQTEN